MNGDLSNCYRLLDLEPGASLDEVKRAYRELVKVWHPDRFSQDSTLQRRAQEKLKEINLAYDRICKTETMGSGCGERGEWSSPRQTDQHDTSAQNGSSGGMNPPRSEPPPPSANPSQQTSRGRRIVQFCLTVFLIALIREYFSASDRLNRQMTQYAPNPTQPMAGYEAASAPAPSLQAEAKANPRHHVTLSQILEFHQRAREAKPDSELSKMSIQEFSLYCHAYLTNYDFSEGFEYAAPEMVMTNKTESIAKVVNPVDYFTVGSTKDEVLAIQGMPSGFTDQFRYEYLFNYGSSEVHFKNGRVITWKQHSSSPLKVRLLPSTKVESMDSFTVGSTKDQVLAVQGTPDEFTDILFKYGLSQVRFRGGRVESWEQSELSPLKVKLSNKSPDLQP